MSIETLNQLKTLINKYESNVPKSRKIKVSDLSNMNNTVQVETNTTKEHIKSFRMQTEYGPKKFIKPWRTGTKSQQLPMKCNFKKTRK